MFSLIFMFGRRGGRGGICCFRGCGVGVSHRLTGHLGLGFYSSGDRGGLNRWDENKWDEEI